MVRKTYRDAAAENYDPIRQEIVQKYVTEKQNLIQFPSNDR
jgi:hypothetical protein